MARRPLKHHQARALKHYDSRTRMFLAMEMRLGKTLTAIRWLEGKDSPLNLVAAPLPCLPGWTRELANEGIRSVLLEGPVAERPDQVHEAAESGVRWFLTNPAGLSEGGHRTPSGKKRPTPTELALLPWSGVVIDESTTIKNPSASWTRVACDVLGGARYRACLSGLPMPEGEHDLFSQMLFLHGRFMGCRTFWQWRDKYFLQAGYDWVPRRGAIKQIKKAFRANAFVLTRKQAGLAVEPIVERLYCDLPPETRRQYRQAERDFEITAGENRRRTAWAPVRFGWMAQLCGGRLRGLPESHSDHKLDLLRQATTGAIHPELRVEPLVVWFRYNAELYAAREMLKKAGVSCETLTGKTPRKRKMRIEDDFAAGRFRVLLAQVACGKFGLNLSRSSTVLWYSLPHSFEMWRQARDRTEHMDKKEPTLHLYLMCRDTVDEDCLETLLDKGCRSNTFMSRFIKRALRRMAA